MAGFYKMCREKIFPILKPLGFKRRKQNYYYRVLNGVVQSIYIEKIGKYIYEMYFTLKPLCMLRGSSFNEEAMFNTRFYDQNGVSILQAEPYALEYWKGIGAEHRRDEYWTEKYYKRIVEVILPWFEIGSNPESAMFALRYLDAHCPPGRREWPYGLERKFPTYIEAEYFFLLQTRKYELAGKFLQDYLLWHQEEYAKKCTEYAVKQVIKIDDIRHLEKYLKMSQIELEQMIIENEQQNLQNLNWK